MVTVPSNMSLCDSNIKKLETNIQETRHVLISSIRRAALKYGESLDDDTLELPLYTPVIHQDILVPGNDEYPYMNTPLLELLVTEDTRTCDVLAVTQYGAQPHTMIYTDDLLNIHTLINAYSKENFKTFKQYGK